MSPRNNNEASFTNNNFPSVLPASKFSNINGLNNNTPIVNSNKKMEKSNVTSNTGSIGTHNHGITNAHSQIMVA